MKSKEARFIRMTLTCLMAGLACALLVIGVRPPSLAQSEPQRLMDTKVPKHVPIKLKLKAEKESRFKDRSNPEWLRDFELELTNTSNKPIYFVELWLVLPDTKTENNNPIAFPLRYGRVDFIRFNTRPIDSDVPIQPGETHTFEIDETSRLGWHQFKARKNASDPAKVDIELVNLSFGDGSGFDGGGRPYPYRRMNYRFEDASVRQHGRLRP